MVTSLIYLCLQFFLLINLSESNSLIGSECNLKRSGKGSCVDYKNCNILVNKLKNREIEIKDVIFCNNYGLVCCPLIVSSNSDLSPPSNLSIKTRIRISEEKCKEYAESTKKINFIATPFSGEKPIKVVLDKCNHKSVPLIIGGIEAKPHEFPHHAILGREDGDSIDWVCGGSLISPQFILTAAHCARPTKFVKIGINSLSQSNDQKVYKIIDKIIHPDYDKSTTNNDIALLKLDQIVEFNENVHPICLPTRQYDEAKAIVTGFGKTSYYEDKSDKLLKVVIEKFGILKCQEDFEDRLIDGKTMLCYGHRTEAKDSCQGDSGGPLQISNENQVHCTYMQIGIVSFGPSLCGSKDIPAIYVNVFNYIDWIEQIVWNSGS